MQILIQATHARLNTSPFPGNDLGVYVSISDKVRQLNQFFTPAWVAEALVRLHFNDLSGNDLVIDPMCGRGRFLQAIPDHVPAMGIEIDPEEAAIAHRDTGRNIIVGDIRQVEITERPTLLIGNPPFKTSIFDAFLEKAERWLVDEGRVGMILPTYFFQTAGRVSRYNETWSLYQELIPRNIYPGLEKPLCFAIFRKDYKRLLVGFSLFHEQAFLSQLPEEIQAAMTQGKRTWKSLVLEAVDELGSEAKLQEIYDYLSDRRPTKNPNWEQQIRKICQNHLQRIGRGRYRRKNETNQSYIHGR